MEFPGFNSFHKLAHKVFELLRRESPLTLEEIYRRFTKFGPSKTVLDFRTSVPFVPAHIEKVLTEHLSGHVALYANGWKLFGPPPPLAPIWKMYDYPWGSMGYRMGAGENYWADWSDFYHSLDAKAQDKYRQENPEPESWRHFYEYLGLSGEHGDPAYSILHEKIDAARKEYLATEFERAVACEREGKKVEALFHYVQVTTRHGHSNYDAALAAQGRLVAEVGWNRR